MTVDNRPIVACGACGKRYTWKAALAGRKVKCACGNVILVPAAESDDPHDEYELAAAPAEPQPARPASGVSADVVLNRLGRIPAPKPLAPDPEKLAADRKLQKRMEPNLWRDTAVPMMLLGAGLALSFYEAMHGSRRPPDSMAAAAPLVAIRAIASMVLCLGGILLATTCFDVCLLGSFRSCMLRLCAIAVAPSAVYGVMCYAIGDVAGSATGTLLAVSLYAVLFYFLLKLDVKDTAICVIVAWILVTGVNYLMYRLQGAQQNSWI
jgi:hypothetical protein